MPLRGAGQLTRRALRLPEPTGRNRPKPEAQPARLALDTLSHLLVVQLREEAGRRGLPGLPLPIFGEISAKCCSFSAVSAPIFASKCAFCSIFQNLPDYLAEIFEIWQNFANFATFAKILLNFHKNC